jgi:WD40 repeat protein
MDSPVHSLAASMRQIVVGYADGTLNLLSLGDQTSVPEIKAHQRTVSAVAFSPKGERFASGSADGEVKVWDGDSLKQLYTLAGHTAQVNSIVFSPDGKQVAAVNADGEVDGWTIR